MELRYVLRPAALADSGPASGVCPDGSFASGSCRPRDALPRLTSRPGRALRQNRLRLENARHLRPLAASALRLVAGQLLAAGAWTLQRRRRPALRAAQTALRAAIDRLGRRWETPVSWIGPPLPSPLPENVTERWHTGAGQLRVECYDLDPIWRLDWWKETLCLGTRGGLVRTVDVESGSVVGDYYLGSHLPAGAITALRFDGSAIVAGDVEGRVHVWSAKLPGSWGFAHSPDWVLSSLEDQGAQVHKAAVTDLGLFGTSLAVVSSDSTGLVVFWQVLGSTRRVEPLCKLKLGNAVNALSTDPQKPEGIYAGCAGGNLVWLQPGREGTEPHQDRVKSFGVDITALAWDTAAQALLIGLQTGDILRWRPGSADEPEHFSKFHHDKVQHIALTMPPEDPGKASVPHVLTASSDGRVGVWDLTTGEPLWGLSGLSSSYPVALGDYTRLICNGLVINKADRSRTRIFSQNWKEPSRGLNSAPTCEALLCYDLLKEDPGGGAEEEEQYWPNAEEKSISQPRHFGE